MVTTAQAYFCSLWYGKVNEYATVQEVCVEQGVKRVKTLIFFSNLHVIPSELVKDSNIGNFFSFLEHQEVRHNFKRIQSTAVIWMICERAKETILRALYLHSNIIVVTTSNTQ